MSKSKSVKNCIHCGREIHIYVDPCPFCFKSNQPQVAFTGARNEVKTKYCVYCGQLIDYRAEICPKCGVRIEEAPKPKELKNPGLAAVLSFFIVGLGQIYNGKILKGGGFFLSGIFLISLTFAFILAQHPLFWIWYIFLLLLWMLNIYDAYKTAKKINAGEMKT